MNKSKRSFLKRVPLGLLAILFGSVGCKRHYELEKKEEARVPKFKIGQEVRSIGEVPFKGYAGKVVAISKVMGSDERVYHIRSDQSVVYDTVLKTLKKGNTVSILGGCFSYRESNLELV